MKKKRSAAAEPQPGTLESVPGDGGEALNETAVEHTRTPDGRIAIETWQLLERRFLINQEAAAEQVTEAVAAFVADHVRAIAATVEVPDYLVSKAAIAQTPPIASDPNLDMVAIKIPPFPVSASVVIDDGAVDALAHTIIQRLQARNLLVQDEPTQ